MKPIWWVSHSDQTSRFHRLLSLQAYIPARAYKVCCEMSSYYQSSSSFNQVAVFMPSLTQKHRGKGKHLTTGRNASPPIREMITLDVVGSSHVRISHVGRHGMWLVGIKVKWFDLFQQVTFRERTNVVACVLRFKNWWYLGPFGYRVVEWLSLVYCDI